MPTSQLPIVLSSAAALGLLAFSGEAQAKHLDACGVWLDADAAGNCEVVPKKTCEQQCEPATVERVCATRLYQDCAPSCTLTSAVECESTCVETCGTSCTNSTSVDCSVLCMSECQGSITGSCGDSPDHCDESGSACCAGSCDAKCEVSNETECTPVCNTACSGSCEASANITCQVECQAKQFESCTDTVVQECHDECTTTGAAIFCDGHFLATGGDLQACADQLKAEFSIDIDVSVDVDVDVSGGNEDDDNKLKDAVSCSVTNSGGGAMGLLLLIALGGRRIRRSSLRAN